jgi:hypothetical protein
VVGCPIQQHKQERVSSFPKRHGRDIGWNDLLAVLFKMVEPAGPHSILHTAPRIRRGMHGVSSLKLYKLDKVAREGLPGSILDR